MRRNRKGDPVFTVAYGQQLKIIVETPDGGAAMVTGTVDRVPETTGTEVARTIVVRGHARPLSPAELAMATGRGHAGVRP